MRAGLPIALSLAALLGSGALCGGGDPPCLTRDVSQRLGRDSLMLGGRLQGTAIQLAPFDLRYHYVTGGVPDAECDDCKTCTVGGVTCANPSPCGWWGCWQRDDEPPGLFVRNFVTWTEQGGAVPMLTYYQWLGLSGGHEGEPEIAALTDGERVRRYLLDYRFLLRTAEEAASGPWLLHLEPDLWGFGRKVSEDPGRVRVALPSDLCGDLPGDFSGLSRCMMRLARTDAPSALVGLHASSWDPTSDAFLNRDPAFDITGHATRTATYLQRLGAADADLVVVEMNHRDAGYNGAWWDDADETLPHFEQARSWAHALSRALGVPHLWWQIPMGHPGLPDTCGAYRDNRLDHVFDHPERFADGTTLGFAFGAGADCMTSELTDGGHFAERAGAWFAAPRPPMCSTKR